VAYSPASRARGRRPVFFRFFYWTGFAFTYAYLELAGF
jgi:hypothetical protein